ncbi:MAG: BspA family leucine-rich repeat surface protein [Muribaculaceae bacterium]|nr:BspA family leucine-rich repeat surface protein [Muribaculaceae bacterium]
MAIIKYKDKDGVWKELTILKGDSGVAPIINPDTNTWLVWDNEQGVYVDTGVVAGVGSEDFYASTYWVFNEMASGKKVIAKALTDRRYPTNNDESFVDMAQKITDMNYEEGWFAKIGYTDENDGGIKNAIDYSYELAKGWNPDGSTVQMFRENKQLVFAPMVDISKYTSLANMFYGCVALSTIPQLDTRNVTNMSQTFYNCTSLSFIPQLDTRNVTNMSQTFCNCTSLSFIPQLDTRNVTNMQQMTRSCDNLRRIEGLYLDKVTAHQFAYNNSSIVFAKFYNLGMSSLVTHDFSQMFVWGTGSEENRQSLIDSLITYSYDRASNGMSTATIKLHANTKALLTEEEIAQISAKGFTIA